MLAIIIPFYKHTFFKDTLESLATQTDKRFKVYIGDDASPKDPVALLECYKNKFDFVYRRFESNLGKESLVKQWERCIALSEDEEWLMLLGDDDYISTNYIEAFYGQIEAIQASRVNVVRYATQVNKFGAELSKVYTHPKIETSPDSFYKNIFKSSRSSLSEHLFRREAYLKHGFRDFPLAWGVDDFAWLDFTEFETIYTINEAIAFIRISPESISRKGYRESQKLEARYIYFSLIIYKYINKFKKEQHNSLYRYYEHLVYSTNHISFRFWFVLSLYYLFHKDILKFFKFQRRILVNKYFRSYQKHLSFLLISLQLLSMIVANTIV
ncbi:glycosyltransferase family 2 protein [Mangrovimonas sp. CR14]|uniref:glycosyltransferase family 2 protein n=1 Tax=Mangrovimonas sp. CR14 TaxID=2706120 RepID=UPI00141FA9D9|nr:glycosyltransferase [Mangrovimonas sp. CR14]NIK92524.1 glycosyltransferase family 2 protein [Mangrovimonas sp. CR14]